MRRVPGVLDERIGLYIGVSQLKCILRYIQMPDIFGDVFVYDLDPLVYVQVY